MRKLGIISKEWNYRDSREKTCLDGLLGTDFEISYFPWGGVCNGIVREVFVNGSKELAVPLSEFDVVYLSSLGMVSGVEEPLRRFMKGLESLPGVVINDPQTMVDNFDKGYLLRLQSEGIPVIPTEEVGHLSYDALKSVYEGKERVLKPKVFGERSNGVWKLEEVDSRERWDIYREAFPGGVLMQPYIEEILEGERSFVYVGDEFSHGVRRARSGWQENSSLIFDVISPSLREKAICERVLKEWPTKYHVTRFDFIGAENNPLISEVEMINPNLWLGRNLEGVDERFGSVFLDYVEKAYDSK